jgi:hypothetical protein
MHKLTFVVIALLGCAGFLMAQVPGRWKNHDSTRPERPVITPAVPSTQVQVGHAPSDAIVLFDGNGLQNWVDKDGKPSKWIVKGDFMECVKGSGFIFTKQGFGDCQLHLEFACPTPPEGNSQGRGNSGVFLMSTYEVQVLDSYQNHTYADGQCAAIYGQHPPMVNACLPPGQWQTYDIIFHRPRFDDRGNLVDRARITVIQNGVLVQDDVEIYGPTSWMSRDAYVAHADKLPLGLQDHGNPVRYRNIWVRELPERGQLAGDAVTRPPDKIITLAPEILDRYVGKYESSPNNFTYIIREGNTLYLSFYPKHKVEITPESESKFNATIIDVQLLFDIDSQAKVLGMTVQHSGEQHKVKKVQ